MKFNKELIYKITDNKIDKIILFHLNEQELNTLYHAITLNHSLKELYLSDNQIKDITLLCKSL